MCLIEVIPEALYSTPRMAGLRYTYVRLREGLECLDKFDKTRRPSPWYCHGNFAFVPPARGTELQPAFIRALSRSGSPQCNRRMEMLFLATRHWIEFKFWQLERTLLMRLGYMAEVAIGGRPPNGMFNPSRIELGNP